ncbi:MAG: alpha/beta hydrolase [bacterium]|nr:alpha/beta hydrolase [bacterium]
MNTIVLPGYSNKNKEWLDELRQKADIKPLDTIEWDHWKNENPNSNWVKLEVAKIINTYRNEKINVVAKSLGTLIAMKILNQKFEMFNKIILCGIPVNDFKPGDEGMYDVLDKLLPNKVICIQNDNDPHGNLGQIRKFLNSVNPDIQLISKESSDHNYPYYEDFRSFLKSV